MSKGSFDAWDMRHFGQLTITAMPTQLRNCLHNRRAGESPHKKLPDMAAFAAASSCVHWPADMVVDVAAAQLPASPSPLAPAIAPGSDSKQLASVARTSLAPLSASANCGPTSSQDAGPTGW